MGYKYRFVPHIAPARFKRIFCGTLIGPGWSNFAGGQRRMLRDAIVQYYQKFQSKEDDGKVLIDTVGLFDTSILTQHVTYHYQFGSRVLTKYFLPVNAGLPALPPLLYLDETLMTLNGVPTNDDKS